MLRHQHGRNFIRDPGYGLNVLPLLETNNLLSVKNRQEKAKNRQEKPKIIFLSVKRQENFDRTKTTGK